MKIENIIVNGSIKNKEIQKLTKEIKNYYFFKDGDLKSDYIKFKNSLQNINNYFYKIYEDNNIKNIKVDNSLIEYKEKYIDTYVYNAIVNYSNYKFRKELENVKVIKEKDIIQEIVFKNYMKNKNQDKKIILNNYLSNNNYRNKYQVQQAIKNINQEMDEAFKEFSKLFNTNDYGRN